MNKRQKRKQAKKHKVLGWVDLIYSTKFATRAYRRLGTALNKLKECGL